MHISHSDDLSGCVSLLSQMNYFLLLIDVFSLLHCLLVFLTVSEDLKNLIRGVQELDVMICNSPVDMEGEQDSNENNID